MLTRHRNNLAWLQGRETGLPPYVGQQDKVCNMLYSSIKVTDFWDPAVSSSENHRGIFNFDFSTDGAALVAACEGKSFLVFDPNNRQLIQARRKAHSDCVNCVRFLDTRSFVTCSDDTTVVLWDLRFLKNRVRIFAGHTSWVKNIEYASSLGLLITSGFDGAVYSWNINNYSKEEECKRLFQNDGLMRCKLSPDESKLILSTSRGYLMIVHDLDLQHLDVNMDCFKSEVNSGSRMKSVVSSFYSLFDRPKNRLEIINEFPARNVAENIASLQVHPQGWCIVSRNTSKDDVTEWTCVHDIHDQPAVKRKEEEEDQHMSGHSPLENSPPPLNSSARTNPLSVRKWGQSSRRRHHPYFVLSSSGLTQRANSQGPVDPLPQSGPDGPAARTLSLEDDGVDETDKDSSGSETGERAGCSSSDGTYSARNRMDNLDLLRYFMRAHGINRGVALHGEEATDQLGSEVDMPDDATDSDHQDDEDSSANENMAFELVSQRTRRMLSNRFRIAMGFEHYLRTYYRNGNVSSIPRNIYQSRPRLVYCQQEPNVGRGFIKEQCFSSDGRLIVSPCGNGIRLLAFDEQCRELCDCEPVVAGSPRSLHQVRELRMHPHVVLTTRFSPTHSLFVSGSLDGSIAFMTPSP